LRIRNGQRQLSGSGRASKQLGMTHPFFVNRLDKPLLYRILTNNFFKKHTEWIGKSKITIQTHYRRSFRKKQASLVTGFTSW
jgi:hypothetical protein